MLPYRNCKPQTSSVHMIKLEISTRNTIIQEKLTNRFYNLFLFEVRFIIPIKEMKCFVELISFYDIRKYKYYHSRFYTAIFYIRTKFVVATSSCIILTIS